MTMTADARTATEAANAQRGTATSRSVASKRARNCLVESLIAGRLVMMGDKELQLLSELDRIVGGQV